MCVATIATALGASASTASTLGIIGTTLQAVGTLGQGIAGYQAGKAQQQAAEVNASIADAQAKAALEDTAQQERQLRRRGAQFAGRQKSLIGASGTGTGGSSMDILMDTYAGIEDDASALRLSGQRKAWGYGIQAQQYRYQGQVARQQGQGALLGSVLSAGSSVLSAGSVDSSWYTKKSMGPSPYGSGSLIHPDRRY